MYLHLTESHDIEGNDVLASNINDNSHATIPLLLLKEKVCNEFQFRPANGEFCRHSWRI